MTPSYFLSLGVLTIPVKSKPAAREVRVELKNLHRACTEAGKVGETGSKTYCKACGLDVGRGDLVKGYAKGPGEYAVIDPATLEALDVESSKVMEIRAFVPLAEVDPVYLGESNWLAPNDQAAAKAFALLREAMRKRKRAAIVQYVQSAREKIGLIRPVGDGLMLHEMWYADEIRPLEMPVKPVELAKEELALAEKLVAAAEGSFDMSQFTDRRRQQLQEIVAAALEGKTVKIEPVAKPATPVPDLMAALQQSVAELEARGKSARKPAKMAKAAEVEEVVA